MTSSSTSIGVALSSGGAAGLAHIGVLEVLREAGIEITQVAGTSAGAMVGAAFAADRLTGLRDRFLGLSTRRQVMRLFDPTWAGGGLFGGRRAMDLIRPFIGERIDDLPRRFAAVATDLCVGTREVIRTGPVHEAIRASAAIPGLFTPVIRNGRLLVDGALVDPIPVEAARELGAGFVIAVSVIPPAFAGPLLSACRARPGDSWLVRSWRAFNSWRHPRVDCAESSGRADPRILGDVGPHSLSDVLARASVVVQAHVAAARMREQRPDFLIQPDVSDIGLFDFESAGRAIEAGRSAAHAALPELQQAIHDASTPPTVLRRLMGGRQAA